MDRTLIIDTNNNIDKEVLIKGWVHSRRDHGKIAFIDVRDRTAIVQVVLTGELAGDLKDEDVVEIVGKVVARSERAVNEKISTGKIEIQASKLEIISKAETLPIPIDGDGYEVSDELRLPYRYLDLRRERLTENIRFRHKINSFIRNWLGKEDFVEIETPILTKTTPEGARDFLVPSRHRPGYFYALPQSPQQYKQLLMVAGFERYFQIARCFRDEDTRKDRQLEFTQLDLEMSFIEREDVMALNEKLLIELVQSVAPEKKIQEIPFPRISYKDAMEKYGNDRPDLRKDKDDPDLLAFCWVIDFPFFEKDDVGGWTFTHNPFSNPKPEHLDMLMKKQDIENILTTQYDIALNGFEIGGGSIRSHDSSVLEKVFEIMGFKKEQIEESFGHMLKAFSYGTPPHGGIAWGLDRLVAILRNENTIREVIAFPSSSTGQTAVMEAPAVVEEKQLNELGIMIKPQKLRSTK